ncbi:MAG: ferritin family protein [Candidatus Bathyarchaeota archaeon]|nr:ferritin family protein [Candidatus Bathyarchaeota archaeon]
MSRLNLKAILETAITIEEQSHTLYIVAKQKAKYPASKKFLDELADQELEHKEKLLKIIRNEEQVEKLGAHSEKIQDLKIVDVMKDMRLSDDANYQELLIFAAKREKATYDYYNSLAEGLEGTEVGKIFSMLAKEELSHKSKLEKEYDEHILWQA